MNGNEKIKYDRALCILLLREKYNLLLQTGEKRFPKRSDFSDEEVVAVKSFLGPWPRALEAAEIKKPRSDDRIAKNREKRARAARKRREAQKKAKKETII